jgi:hypothetical protein
MTVTGPSININNLASGQCDSPHSFSNVQRTPTQYGAGIGTYWDSSYLWPTPESSFHVADVGGQHSDPAYGTFSCSQLDISQPSPATLNTFWGIEDTINPSNLQSNLRVQHNVSNLPDPKATQYLEEYLDCSVSAQSIDVGRFGCEPPEKEIVCFGMVRKFRAWSMFCKLH